MQEEDYFLRVILPAAEIEFSGQGVQRALEGGSGPAASYVATLYLPLEHIEHTLPLTPENPFLH